MNTISINFDKNPKGSENTVNTPVNITILIVGT